LIINVTVALKIRQCQTLYEICYKLKLIKKYLRDEERKFPNLLIIKILVYYFIIK